MTWAFRFSQTTASEDAELLTRVAFSRHADRQ
jgi:hypothetical protein